MRRDRKDIREQNLSGSIYKTSSTQLYDSVEINGSTVHGYGGANVKHPLFAVTFCLFDEE